MLKRLLTEDGELTKISRRFVWMLVVSIVLLLSGCVLGLKL